MVPTKSPGTLFSALTGGDATLNVRWLMATDPVMFEVLNRPIADTVLRQLVLAKAVDNLQLRLGYQALYPYIIQPKVASGTTEVDVPIGWIWDIHASLPKKWENLRLAKIKRVSGDNAVTTGYSGKIRAIFTANVKNSATEVAIFYADYNIDSYLTYQPVALTVVPSTEENVVINAGEEETVAGNIIFKTLDVNDATVQAFYDLLEPPTNTTDSNADGLFDNPATYEIVDNVAGGSAVSDDYSVTSISHGTGMLTDSAWNAIPQLDSDIQTWLSTFNYPFDSAANRTSVDPTAGIVIPIGMFKEFDITAPAGDQPTGDVSGTYYPVWISKIEKVTSTKLRFYFSTYYVTDAAVGGTPSTQGEEFAILDLLATGSEGDIVSITPINNLVNSAVTSSEFTQHFGRGHVVLSSLWDGTSTEISDFFDVFDTLPEALLEFSVPSTRLSSFGISRVPKYVPTAGQSYALAGTTANRDTPIYPSDTNRYITEQDQGLGDQVDLESLTGISPNAAINRYGFSGSLAHRAVKLVVDATMVGSDPAFYEDEILPRLTVLLGRAPQFGDFWHNGTRLMFYNGDTWQG